MWCYFELVNGSTAISERLRKSTLGVSIQVDFLLLR